MCQTVKQLNSCKMTFSNHLLAYDITTSHSLTTHWHFLGDIWTVLDVLGFLSLKDGDNGGDYAQGPDSLHSLFHWSTSVLDKLFGTSDGHEVPQEGLTRLQDLHVILTSEFSGMGTAELDAELLIRSIQERCQIGGWLGHQTMTDLNLLRSRHLFWMYSDSQTHSHTVSHWSLIIQ